MVHLMFGFGFGQGARFRVLLERLAKLGFLVVEVIFSLPVFIEDRAYGVCDINTSHGAPRVFLMFGFGFGQDARFCVLLERLAKLGFLVVEVIFRFHLVTEHRICVKNLMLFCCSGLSSRVI